MSNYVYNVYRIMERAYKLRDERERLRNEHVKASLDKQWRDACDDARTLDSEALLKLVSKERQQQIEAKNANKQIQAAEEREHTAAWLKHVEEMERIEAQKDIDRLANERQTASLISLQVLPSDLSFYVIMIIFTILIYLASKIESNKKKKAELREKAKKEDTEEIQMVFSNAQY